MAGLETICLLDFNNTNSFGGKPTTNSSTTSMSQGG